MRQRWVYLLLILGGSLSVAIQGAAAVQQTDHSGASKSSAGLATTNAVEPINAIQLRERLKSWNGQVILVNLWATWCIPCVKEFPDLSKLEEQYKGRGLKVVGISLDEPGDFESKVKPFVAKQAPAFLTYHCQESDPDKLVSVIDEAWSGMLPTSYIFDRSGTLQKVLLGRKSFEEFETLLTPYLQPAADSSANASALD